MCIKRTLTRDLANLSTASVVLEWLQGPKKQRKMKCRS